MSRRVDVRKGESLRELSGEKLTYLACSRPKQMGDPWEMHEIHVNWDFSTNPQVHMKFMPRHEIRMVEDDDQVDNGHSVWGMMLCLHHGSNKNSSGWTSGRKGGEGSVLLNSGGAHVPRRNSNRSMFWQWVVECHRVDVIRSHSPDEDGDDVRGDRTTLHTKISDTPGQEGKRNHRLAISPLFLRICTVLRVQGHSGPNILEAGLLTGTERKVYFLKKYTSRRVWSFPDNARSCSERQFGWRPYVLKRSCYATLRNGIVATELFLRTQVGIGYLCNRQVLFLFGWIRNGQSLLVAEPRSAGSKLANVFPGSLLIEQSDSPASPGSQDWTGTHNSAVTSSAPTAPPPLHRVSTSLAPDLYETFHHNSVQFLMNSCHEEVVRDRNRAGIEADEPALRAGSIPARFWSRTPSS
eukprot:gene7469-biopygen149